MKLSAFNAFGVISFISLLLTPITASASPLTTKTGKSLNDSLDSWTNTINGLAPTVSFMFSALFTIMFLIGVSRVGYSVITKTGQVMKSSTGLLIWVPISYFFIRIFILVLFTTDSKGVTLLASDMISLISAVGYYLAVGMVLIGLVLFLFYKLIEHPEFGRWSKRLWLLSGLLTLLITIIPFVLGAA